VPATSRTSPTSSETDGVRLVDLSEESVDATIAELADSGGGVRALIQPRVAGS
jgi:hypothetical protein